MCHLYHLSQSCSMGSTCSCRTVVTTVRLPLRTSLKLVGSMYTCAKVRAFWVSFCFFAFCCVLLLFICHCISCHCRVCVQWSAEFLNSTRNPARSSKWNPARFSVLGIIIYSTDLEKIILNYILKDRTNTNSFQVKLKLALVYCWNDSRSSSDGSNVGNLMMLIF